MEKRTAVVKVAQGLGDIFWVYRKLYSYFTNIQFEILTLTDRPMEGRSLKLFDGYPKVDSVKLIKSTQREYERLLQSKPRLDDLLNNKETECFNFICNLWLETGTYIEKIDNDHKVAWDIPVPVKPIANLPQQYIVLYASGEGRHIEQQVWNPMQYSVMAREYLISTGKLDHKVVLIGADYDDPVQSIIEQQLKDLRLDVVRYQNLPVDQLAYLFQKAECFLGYQSGLNILADHMDCKQLMLYFNHNTQISDTWVKPKNRNGKFHWINFKDSMIRGLGKIMV